MRGSPVPPVRYPHAVFLENNGKLAPDRNSADDVARLFEEVVPRALEGHAKRRLLLYVHGGLVPEASALEVLDKHRLAFFDDAYPIAVVWRTGLLNTLDYWVADRKEQEGTGGPEALAGGSQMDEPIVPLREGERLVVRALEVLCTRGRFIWNEMKENAHRASVEWGSRDCPKVATEKGGMLVVLDALESLVRKDPDLEVHLMVHSAGAILAAPFVKLWASEGRVPPPPEYVGLGLHPLPRQSGLGRTLHSITFLAPACTMDDFGVYYHDLLEAGRLGKAALYVLSDAAEQADDCIKVYPQSLLYLVSNAFEGVKPSKNEGKPLLGMYRHVVNTPAVRSLLDSGRVELVIAEKTRTPRGDYACKAVHHGDFDTDIETLHSVRVRIREAASMQVPVKGRAGLPLPVGEPETMPPS
ncbi:MAG TPA: hypothetical protein VNZ52_08715 [Candidatus Thermoplasmatota archaeon]|nr:hypothetical protein [Candidatus Thermoplasmatota archaeon]